MARLTVEDCLQHVDNRFDLILRASKRAREIIRGGDPLVPWDNDQPTVVALREIADGLHVEDEHAPALPKQPAASNLEQEIADDEEMSAAADFLLGGGITAADSHDESEADSDSDEGQQDSDSDDSDTEDKAE